MGVDMVIKPPWTLPHVLKIWRDDSRCSRELNVTCYHCKKVGHSVMICAPPEKSQVIDNRLVVLGCVTTLRGPVCPNPFSSFLSLRIRALAQASDSLHYFLISTGFALKLPQESDAIVLWKLRAKPQRTERTTDVADRDYSNRVDEASYRTSMADGMSHRSCFN
ncbi:hypothetical protein RB195_011027 [Necator americanus]|uniref:CCHC-type domain-containing protein n=1 Tax=Necator americanus TaxID=51031 RepID=A0ABR1D0J8_NECAM